MPSRVPAHHIFHLKLQPEIRDQYEINVMPIYWPSEEHRVELAIFTQKSGSTREFTSRVALRPHEIDSLVTLLLEVKAVCLKGGKI